MAGFDLADLMRDVSRLDTGREQITYIPIEEIDPDPDNFYSLDGVNELAGSIEMLGLQQPILVRPSKGGRFIVISGHRRLAAILMIRDGGSKQFADGVPCIVDRSEASAALQELKLIMANSDTRKMSSADQNKQAERIEDLLRQLVDEGYEFPGRLRDWVSKLSGMSRTKLARMKVIREKLDKPLLREYYNKGLMNEAVAYELAQRPVEMQRRICDAYIVKSKDLRYMQASFVTDYVKLTADLEKRKCPVKTGCRCTNQERILDKVFDATYGYKPCKHGQCCADCSEYLRCRDRCLLMDEKAKAERARQREATKEQKAVEKAQRDAAVYTIEHVWARFGQALHLAGITDKQLRKQLKTGQGSYNEYETYVDKEKTEALLDFSCTEIKSNDTLPFYYGFRAEEYRRLCAIADALHVSLDYLFLRDDVPDRRELAAPETAKQEVSVRFLGWLTCTAPSGVKCWAKFMGEETEDFTMMATYDADAGAWYCGDSLSKFSVIDQKCIGWWPLPDDNALDLPADLTPQPVSETDTPAIWHTSIPEKDGAYWCKIQCGKETKMQPARWYGDAWHFYSIDATIETPVLAWWPLPTE